MVSVGAKELSDTRALSSHEAGRGQRSRFVIRVQLLKNIGYSWRRWTLLPCQCLSLSMVPALGWAQLERVAFEGLSFRVTVVIGPSAAMKPQVSVR